MSQARVERIHFVGIGGTGMSGLAEVLLTMGYRVSGSDLSTSEVTDRLESLGARIFEGHAAAHVSDAHLVVISSAVRPSNPEVRRARRRNVPTLKRGEMLAEIMRLRFGIAVAGSHGKTTTTSLVGHLLEQAGLEPTVIVGGRLKKIGANARLGSGDYLVAEADESDGSFLDLHPTIAVVTNVDREHLDRYRGLVDVKRAFAKFMRRVPFYGLAVVCGDDPNVRSLLPQMRKRVLTYGFGESNDLRALDLSPDGLEQTFRVERAGESLGTARLALPGRHNILNALAAVGVGMELGVEGGRALRCLEGFHGVGRRFEIRGERSGVLLVDDYGHHPTELAAVLSTARHVYAGRRLVVFFQPHRYSRTRALAREFAEVLAKVDVLALADIYPGGEKPIPGVDVGLIAGGMHALHDGPVHRVGSGEAAIDRVAALLEPGDVLLTLGAGSISRWGPEILARYEGRGASPRPSGAPVYTERGGHV